MLDPKNRIDAVKDIANLKAGKIAAVARFHRSLQGPEDCRCLRACMSRRVSLTCTRTSGARRGCAASGQPHTPGRCHDCRGCRRLRAGGPSLNFDRRRCSRLSCGFLPGSTLWVGAWMAVTAEQSAADMDPKAAAAMVEANRDGSSASRRPTTTDRSGSRSNKLLKRASLRMCP